MLNDEDMLNIGRFKLPLYDKQYNPYMIYQTGLPYKSDTVFICLSLSFPFESDARYLDFPFVIPKLHLKKSENLILKSIKEQDDKHLKIDKDKTREEERKKKLKKIDELALSYVLFKG